MSETPEPTALRTLIVTGLLAALSAVLSATVQGYWEASLAEERFEADSKLAAQKFTSDLVLKALEADSSDARIQTLDMLVRTNIIDDPEIVDGITTYLASDEVKKAGVPQVKSALSPPVIDNARVYLLAGSAKLASGFDDWKQKLAAAGFPVIGQQKIDDPGRPLTPEVRFFNDEDAAQASAIAGSVSESLGTRVPANPYKDASAKPGYIEIWLGK